MYDTVKRKGPGTRRSVLAKRHPGSMSLKARFGFALKLFVFLTATILSFTLIWKYDRSSIGSQTPDVMVTAVTSSKSGYNHPCENWFHESFEENLKTIANYPSGNVYKYLSKIDGNMVAPAEMRTFPVIVTGCDHTHYDEIQGLFKNLHEEVMPEFKDLKIVFYDLGLFRHQRKQLEEQCRCEVREFPFQDFPHHVRILQKYTWKPIIVQKTLMEFGAVWWLDASIRLIPSGIPRAIEYARKHGILFFVNEEHLSVARQTDKRVMKFLKEDACKFRYFSEVGAGYVMYIWNNVTKIVVRSWVTCALNEECMAPPGAQIRCNFDNKSDGRCHRFDQAILSIFLRRLYHDQQVYPDIKPPLRLQNVKWDEKVKYFS